MISITYIYRERGKVVCAKGKVSHTTMSHTTVIFTPFQGIRQKGRRPHTRVLYIYMVGVYNVCI